MRPVDIAGWVLSGVYAWVVVVVAHAFGTASDSACTIGGTMAEPRQVYYELHRNMILPAIAGTALVALINNFGSMALEWWATLFFFIYYSAEFALTCNQKTTKLSSFVLDILSMSVFALVLNAMDAFGPQLQPAPKAVFIGILAIPLFGGLSRGVEGKQPRIAPSIVAIGGGGAGLLATYLAWPPAVTTAAMVLLGAMLLKYVACIVADDAGNPAMARHLCFWCR
jgi:hypothetical protein